MVIKFSGDSETGEVVGEPRPTATVPTEGQTGVLLGHETTRDGVVVLSPASVVRTPWGTTTYRARRGTSRVNY